MSKKKQKKTGIWGMILSFIVGGIIGILLVVCMENHITDGLTAGQNVLQRWIMLLSLYFAMFLQIVIHEAGHLVFGLASGYQFVSFRIASIQLTRADGKFRWHRHSLAGTAGQCLMSPPELVDGEMPVLLYNLGGSLMNLIAAGSFLILYFVSGSCGVFAFFCLAMAIVGLLFALTNGIPMRLGSVDNDGFNALSIRKSKDAMRSLWLQLKINAELSNGKRLKEMPDEWFTVPPDEAMGNSMVATIGVFACNRLMDQNRYAEADALMEHILSIESGLVGVYRNMLTCDRMCCEMISQNRREIVDNMYTSELRSFMKSMKSSPSVLRTQYIYALLTEHNYTKGVKLREKFEKVVKTYPYPNDVQSDRELIETAQHKSESEAQCHG